MAKANARGARPPERPRRIFRRLASRLTPEPWRRAIRQNLAAPDHIRELRTATSSLDRRLAAHEGKLADLKSDREEHRLLANRMAAIEQDRRWGAAQILQHRYRSLSASPPAGSTLNDWECRVYSQNGEDGILLEIFSRIGAKNYSFVEFGIGDGTECNTANLSLHFGWRGLLMDVDATNVERARLYYGGSLGPTLDGLRIAQHRITAENIDEVLVDEGADSEIDLLSIDIDGNDYWVWSAVSSVSPRVVVIEYNASFGPDRSVTVRYDPLFDRFEKHPSGFYHGASVAALQKLGARKGYALLGCDSNGVNAFFVRSDLIVPGLEPVQPAVAYRPLFERSHLALSEQTATIAHLELVDV